MYIYGLKFRIIDSARYLGWKIILICALAMLGLKRRELIAELPANHPNILINAVS